MAIYRTVKSKPSANYAQTVKSFRRSTLAIAISGSLLSSMAYAQESSIELDKLKVEEEVSPDTNPYAEPGAPYLGKISADPRRTRPLAETPQTISVLTQQQIQDSGRSDLRDILDAQPGITLGTGENGNAFGDRYIIRGHEARSDMFVDGLRDPGMTIRESFAVEQVEITKGPSSTFAGRGSTGGAVNSATKRASTEYDFTKLEAGIGSDNQYRVSVDSNQVLNFDTALRVNLMDAAEDVPGREPADRNRQGAAISLTHQPTDNLEITADYYHFAGEDKPDLGSYIPNEGTNSSGDTVYGEPVDIPVYAQDEDFLESNVDTLTLRLGYEISPGTRLINLTRSGTTDNGYVVTGASASTAYATEADAIAQSNEFETASMSTHQGWQEVDYFANQLNLITRQQIGDLNHEMVFGLEYSDQSVLNGVYQTSITGAGNCWANNRGTVSLTHCIVDENGNASENLNNLLQREIVKGDFDSDWNVKTTSVSAMDTVDLNDRWTVFGGLRLDSYDYKTIANFDPDGRTGPLPSAPTSFEDSDEFWNGHLGVTYKFRPDANIYASYSTATNINGGESDVGANCGYGGICVDGSDVQLGTPENTVSIELGSKWQLMGGKLLASGALFQITKDDVMETANGDSYSTEGSLNTGKNRVEGIELGLSGNVTDKVSIQAGITVMNAEVLDSNNSDNIGKTLANFAEKSASLHLKYQATSSIAIGGTMTYESERYTGQPDTAANEAMDVPEYTIYDAFAIYEINRNFKTRLNIGNLTDEDYYLAAYRSGSFAYKGDARNIRLTIQYDF